MIPTLDLFALDARNLAELSALENALRETGFLVLDNTGLTTQRVEEVLAAYRAFFHLPLAQKSAIDMARTGGNRGWGASGSEQENPQANPDYKEVFDCGVALRSGHPLSDIAPTVHAPNLWPDAALPGFRPVIESYQRDAMAVAMRLLRAMAAVIGGDETRFDTAFATPMALLRGNFYPARPDRAGAADFGIAPHTDYGCLTLLATDGAPGLEVDTAQGWQPLSVPPGQFVVNFGEMFALWSDGAVRATPHRVIGTAQERVSVPLFFNPSYSCNIAPEGSEALLAGEYLSRRFEETYVHLKLKSA